MSMIYKPSGVYSTDENGHLSLRRMRALTVFSIFILFVCLVVFNGPAWSLERESGFVAGTGSEKSLTSSKPAITEDACLPLLKTVSHSPALSAMDRDRRSAGNAAVLGLVFGVRFALGPKEVMKPGKGRAAVGFEVLQQRETGGMHALAVSEYRRCRNEKALKALSDDWRWSR